MRRISTIAVLPLATGTLAILTTATAFAQVIPGQGSALGGKSSSVIGQPHSGQSNSIIGQPMPGGKTGAGKEYSAPDRSGIGQPVPGGQRGYSPAIRSEPARDSLNRANREAADIDRNGRLSPNEASRFTPLTPLTQ